MAVFETSEEVAADAARVANRDRRGVGRPDLSLVIPTYNESENLPILIDRLTIVLGPIDYEIIVVDDDSPDGTWQIAEELATTRPRLRSIRRTGERGLSSAVMMGMSVARGEAIAVMDADLQHDPSILPRMIAPILAGEADVSVASREVEGGSYGSFARSRRTMSVLGASMARMVTSTNVTDPMSGFFAISRAHHTQVADRANPRGFKILLEFLVRGPKPRVQEFGYLFGERQHGETKLTSSVAFAYLLTLVSLLTGRVMSATMTAYAMVGLFGVSVRFGAPFIAALFGFTLVPLVAFELSVWSNYWMNNRFTFAAEQRRGLRLLVGFLPFQLVALHGLVVQAGVTSLATGSTDAVGGPVLLQLAGIALATVGNYALNRSVTWRRAS
ncbi:MAG: dolichol-phosphate mannosyltransferase [Acidimicrobiales bacterium]|jgi:dolichol-phosphate mannosyltransferase